MSESWNVETQSYGTGQVKQNIFLGIIGAFVGALLGSVLWIVIYRLGYVAAIAGIAIAWCACKGYAMLSKGKDMKAAIIPTIIALIVVTLAHFFCWGLEIYNVYSEVLDITMIDAMLSVPEIAFTSEIILDFLRDLAIGYVTVIVGAFPFIRRAKEARQQREVI